MMRTSAKQRLRAIPGVMLRHAGADRDSALAFLALVASAGPPSSRYHNLLRSEHRRLSKLTAAAYRREVQRPMPASSVPVAASSDYRKQLYPEYLHGGMHPGQLETMARVFGLRPAPADGCRVLELGCSTGFSLRAFAMDLKASEFVGIDYSDLAIQKAREGASRLKLKNLHFQSCDVADLGQSELGRFDYILAHGLYSWVAPPVREAILAAIERHLSPRGIAYISFATLPGAHLLLAIRELGIDVDPRRLPPILQAELKRVKKNRAQAQWDEFGEHNEPVLFQDFLRAAAQHGLRYAAESEIGQWTALPFQEGSPGRRMLDAAPDPASRMQLRDFLLGTSFHRILLCRSRHQPASAPLLDQARRMLLSVRGLPFETGHPVVQRMLLQLSAWDPLRATLDQLLPAAADRKLVLPWLLPLWESGLVDLHTHMPEMSLRPGRRPKASPFAREVAARGSRIVPSLLGFAAQLSSRSDAALLASLDGSVSRSRGNEEQLNQFARLGLLL